MHPGIFEAYMRGRVVPRVMAGGKRLARAASQALRDEERAVLSFLQRHLNELSREQAPGGLTQLLGKSLAKARRRA